WDALADAVAAGCCGRYADMVARFILDSQDRRAKIAEKQKDFVEAQPPTKSQVCPQPVLPAGLPIPNTTVKVKGGKVVSDKFTQGVKETYFATLTDPATQVTTSRKVFRRIRAAEGES